VPIQLFAFCYFGLALKRFFGSSLRATALGTLAFFAFALLFSGGIGSLLPQPARGSAGYAAFLLGLAGVAGALLRRPGDRDTARLVGLVGVVFALALAFRALDGERSATAWARTGSGIYSTRACSICC
jgi:hypothetical protein